MKRIMFSLVGCLLAVLLMVPVPFARCEARSIRSAEDAELWVSAFFSEHPEVLADEWLATEPMAQAVAASGGWQGLAASLAGLGQLQQRSPAYAGKLQGYTAYYIPCMFTEAAMDLILITDQGAVAGLSTGAYTGDRASALEAYEQLPLSLPAPALDGALPGTLTLPKGAGPFPAVVLVHGSGPNDRDETLMAQKPFRDLAEGLAEQGIAVYRYDKRTLVYGEDLAKDEALTLVEETIEDAAAAVQLLAQQERIDPNRIFVLGHSLGGSAIPAIDRALREQPIPAAGYILMAASPRRLDELMREQVEFLYSLVSEPTPEQLAQRDQTYAQLELLREPDDLREGESVLGAYKAYWQWLADYDILAAAQEITAPCLVIQGEEDYQVTMKDFRLWEEKLSGRVNWRLISYPGLTHTFAPGEKNQGPAAYARPETVDARVVRDIAEFIWAQ
ncbi:MAG: alpha/beta fold hydrolase [Clostridia bacterium]|nr:alpha/beta fold hydrolase [Clostridia bacterium]